MEKKIGVGIVGASPLNPGCAVAAHIPAIQALPEYYELKAVSLKLYLSSAPGRLGNMSIKKGQITLNVSRR